MGSLTMNQLPPLKLSPPFLSPSFNIHLQFSSFRTIRNRKKRKNFQLSAQIDESQSTATATAEQQQVNLSVLRFTFGIPWLDESYLPRWIGYGFGSLILLNHFVGSSSLVTSAQIVSEVLGLSLAAFSVTLPYLGKFLKGATTVNQITPPEGAEQIFVMSNDISDNLKEDLAWASYVLLRNTNSLSVLILVNDVLCVRGYWNTPDKVSKADIVDWFKDEIEKFDLFDLKETLYFPKSKGSMLEKSILKGTGSILIQPLLQASVTMENENKNISGFVLLASSVNYAYSDKERSWIRAIANKFTG